MWKLYTISILLLAGTLPACPAHAQNIAPTGNLSRLLQQSRSATADTGRIAAVLQLSNWYLTRAGDDRNNLDSATLLATEAAALSEEHGYPNGSEEARFLLAKTAFKEKDWPRLRHLADACGDSTRVRLALTVMNAHDLLKFVSPADTDSALAFFKHILVAPAPTRTPLGQTLLLLRLAIYYRSRDDSVTSTAPTLSSVDFTRTSGPGNWTEGLHRWLSYHLHADPLAMTALAALSTASVNPNKTGTAAITPNKPGTVTPNKSATAATTSNKSGIPAFTPNQSAPPPSKPTPNKPPSLPLDTRDAAAICTIQRTAARAISYEAGIHWNKGELGIAEKGYLLGIEMARKCPIVEAWSYFSILEFYLSNGNASRALFYGIEAVSRLQRSGNPGLEYEPWWCLGQIYFELGKPALARGYYDTVLTILHKRNQNPDAWLFKSITQCYLKENDPAGGIAFLRSHVVPGDMGELLYHQLVTSCYADCYFTLGNYPTAEALYLDCYNHASHINRYNLSLAAYSLGKLYIHTLQYDKARTYLQPLLQPADYFLVPLYLQRDVHLLLYIADSATGNYPSAIKHLRTQESLNDSLFNIARNGQVQELTFRYETERKDRDLSLQEEHIRLLQNQAQLQRATLRQVRTSRNTLIGGLVMLFLLLALLYSRFRTKQRSNRLLRLQQHALNNTNRELLRLNTRQQRLLAEKEWLINEVHHRVKTNLQIVTSLLNMQVAHLNDEFTLHAFGEIGSRIRTLSLIHQRLYREDGNMTTISMRDYIHELAGHLLETFDLPTIRIHQHIDPIDLNITQCVPVGLILNEAISNALLFAFPNATPGETLRAAASGAPPSGAPVIRYPTARSGDGLPIEGVIDITMRLDPDGCITLTIADNGIGLPPGFDPDRDSAMGLQLIKTLGQQLDGVTLVENRYHPLPPGDRHPGACQGLCITVIFQRQESDLTPI